MKNIIKWGGVIFGLLLSLVLVIVIFSIITGLRGIQIPGTGTAAGGGTPGTGGTSGSAGGNGNGACLNVPYIQEGGNNAGPHGGWCGRASQAMLASFFNPSNTAIQTFDWQNAHPLSLGNLDSTTGQNYVADKTCDTDAAIQSVQNGYPVIAETNLCGQHIFVLTGYDDSTQTFSANNTYGCSSSTCSSATCTTSICGVVLTKANLNQHLAPQGACYYLVK
ncbi:MAG: C39 family peptidase [Patescibacteria group bacterium]|jgi:hypothetical protein